MMTGLSNCWLNTSTAAPSMHCCSISERVQVLHGFSPLLTKRVVPIGVKASSHGNEEVAALEAKGSGTTARGRRLLKVREEKRRREYERQHNYPAWAKVLEDACRDDMELRAVLGDSVGNPELMKRRVEERVQKKGRDFRKSKTGSVLAFKVSFRDFNPLDSYIWLELYGAPSDRDVDLVGSTVHEIVQRKSLLFQYCNLADIRHCYHCGGMGKQGPCYNCGDTAQTVDPPRACTRTSQVCPRCRDNQLNMYISHTRDNPGRTFLKCQDLYGEHGCGYFVWSDPPGPYIHGRRVRNPIRLNGENLPQARTTVMEEFIRDNPCTSLFISCMLLCFLLIIIKCM